MNNQTKVYFNYVVSFSDGAVKTGITSKPFYRLQDYVQEAHRHSVKVDGFNLSPPSVKRVALDIESQLCESQSYNSIDGHREWFFLDCSWVDEENPENNLEKYHIFDFLSGQMNLYWKIKNSAHIGGDYFGPILHKFSTFIEFAAKLGKDGDRISATRATRLAAGFVHA